MGEMPGRGNELGDHSPLQGEGHPLDPLDPMDPLNPLDPLLLTPPLGSPSAGTDWNCGLNADSIV